MVLVAPRGDEMTPRPAAPAVTWWDVLDCLRRAARHWWQCSAYRPSVKGVAWECARGFLAGVRAPYLDACRPTDQELAEAAAWLKAQALASPAKDLSPKALRRHAECLLTIFGDARAEEAAKALEAIASRDESRPSPAGPATGLHPLALTSFHHLACPWCSFYTSEAVWLWKHVDSAHPGAVLRWAVDAPPPASPVEPSATPLRDQVTRNHDVLVKVQPNGSGSDPAAAYVYMPAGVEPSAPAATDDAEETRRAIARGFGIKYPRPVTWAPSGEPPPPSAGTLGVGREPIPMILHCPDCRARHVDAGEFATKPHHTHSCQSCGLTWRPAVVHTVGVQFLPGFKDEPRAPGPRTPYNGEVMHPDWNAAILKRKQLEEEISASSATPGQKRDMQHTLSKLWMFAAQAPVAFDGAGEKATPPGTRAEGGSP